MTVGFIRVDKPEDGIPSWREAPPIVPAEKGRA